MIEQQALVSRIAGNRVYIKSLQNGACTQCAKNRSCGTTLYAKALPDREMALFTELPLAVGDTVLVGIEESHLLKASLFMYLLPLLLMLGTVGLADGSDTSAAVYALASLCAGFYLINRLQRRFLQRFMTPPQIIKKL